MRTKVHYVDSEGKEKSVFADEIKGTLEVDQNMALINTTELDVVSIISLQQIEE